ncbi:MAG: glycosyltransferase family 39 protein [Acidobacteriota bacterium]
MTLWLLAGLPFLCGLLLWRALAGRLADGRERMLVTAAALGVWIVFLSEGLSLFGALGPWPVRIVWIALAALAMTLATRFSPLSRRSGREAGRGAGGEGFDGLDLAFLAVSAAVMLALLAIALTAPPNTYDSMTYHMTRVLRWIQQGSLRHFPSHNLRQVQYGPFSELAILHLYLLKGTDRLANLPQWLAMVGSVIGVSALAARLGAGRAGQVLAGVFCLTLPMGIVQATGTQTDYVEAFWLVCLAYALLRLLDSEGAERGAWVWTFGAAFGLALCTKASGYLYTVPFGVWLLIGLWRARKWEAWRVLVPVGLLVLALNAGTWWRNQALFGSPLGTEANRTLVANSAWTPGIVVSNAIRNLAVHANVPWVDVRGPVDRAVRRVHGMLGLDVEDTRSTYRNSRDFRLLTRPNHEDEAGNGFHLLVILSVLIALAFRPRREVVVYALAVVAGFLLLCLYLRWQHWISRLQLPLFVLMAPVVGTLVPRRLSRFVAAALLVLAIPPVVHDDTRLLLGEGNVFSRGRTEMMFANRPELYAPYLRLAEEVRASGCRRIGLITGYNDYEYPFWVMLDAKVPLEHRIEHVEVDNESTPLLAREPFAGFRPCLVVSLRAPDLGVVARR